MSVGITDQTWCEVPWRSVFVTVDGVVRPCCDYCMRLGQLADQGALAIWESRFERLRQMMNEGHPPPGCGNCCAARVGKVKGLR